MKMISLASIGLGVISALIGLISRMQVHPLLGLESKPWAGVAVLFLLLAIALNTTKKD
ncbi:MAG: hypothetical protein ABII64_08640 [Elusimicrobiota bacterium]